MSTTAYWAYEGLRHGNPPRTGFTWETILKSDNSRLNTLPESRVLERLGTDGDEEFRQPLRGAKTKHGRWISIGQTF